MGFWAHSIGPTLISTNKNFATAAMFALRMNGMLHGPKRSRLDPAKTQCRKCGCKIPPGKTGRKCAECRQSSYFRI